MKLFHIRQTSAPPCWKQWEYQFLRYNLDIRFCHLERISLPWLHLNFQLWMVNLEWEGDVILKRWKYKKLELFRHL